MAEWKFGIDDEEENEEEGYSAASFQFGNKDALVMLIDCSRSMFMKEHDDEESAFELCIKCAKNTIQNKIFSSDRDFLGVIFYATEQSNGEFKHVNVFHELKLPGAEEVKMLEKLLEVDNDNFNTKFGHSEDYSLADALWTCSNLFSNCTQKLGFKRIMLFTNNDNPHPDGQLRRQAIAKVEDLQQNHIELDLMHMNPLDKPFDVQAFYKDILYADDDELTSLPDPAEKFEELLSRVRAKNHKKRALTRIPLTLGEGLSMSVGVYCLVRSCTKPSAIKLYKKTNEEVKAITRTFLKDTGEILMPQDLHKSQTYAGKKIVFEPDEVTQMKCFGSPELDVLHAGLIGDNVINVLAQGSNISQPGIGPGFQLMGFKPKSMIKPYFHVRPAQFIYPDESSVKGSTVLFTALLKKTIEKGVVAICQYIMRKNTQPRFVALFPQAEELDERKVQVAPPGFHVIFLPFADDFRKVPVNKNRPRANAAQIDKAKELIKKLQFAFNSENFENPSLQKHFACVEAMALDRDTVDEVVDFTLPDEEKIEKRAGKIVEEFKALVFPSGYQPGVKRKAPGGSKSGAAVKAENIDIDIEKEARAHQLGKLTVNVLKDCVKKLKIKSVGAKKGDLIDAINVHFGL